MSNLFSNNYACCCFYILEQYLSGKGIPNLSKIISPDKYPLFVTWKSNPQKILRGCIGSFQAESLIEQLPKYALISSLKDERFPPVNKDELSLLECSVSLLVNFEDVESIEDWEIGVHGITINFKNEGKKYSGTFLPSVAVEQHWSKKDTLIQLIKKSGFNGDYKLIWDKIQLTKYQAKVYTASYSE